MTKGPRKLGSPPASPGPASGPSPAALSGVEQPGSAAAASPDGKGPDVAQPPYDPNAPENRTIGDLLGILPGAPSTESPALAGATGLPGFAMGDEPPPLPPGFGPFESAPQAAPTGQPPSAFPHSPDPYDPAKHAPGQQPSKPQAPRPAAAVPELPAQPEFILPGGTIRYESRIKVLEAFRYPGSFRDAPAWIDRNWLGYSGYDPLRGIEPGPCLRVPVSSGVIAECRIGDYVVQQEFIIGDGRTSMQLEVWNAEHFEKTFMPVTSSRPQRPSTEDASLLVA